MISMSRSTGEGVMGQAEGAGEEQHPARPRLAPTDAPMAVGGQSMHVEASPKACQSCARIDIGVHYVKISPWRVFAGLPFVYLPILALPIILLGAGLVYVHLRMNGARNLKTLRDFLPAWESHRYRYKTQIVKRDVHPLARWTRTRAYWFFNCTLYCPFSVATLEWAAYLTKAVENWWCPFAHQQKPNYAGSAIDYSFWHSSQDVAQLNPEDRDNPIWNRDTAQGPRPASKESSPR
jgi:hypothetical protein